MEDVKPEKLRTFLIVDNGLREGRISVAGLGQHETGVRMDIRSEKIDELAHAALVEKLDATFARELRDYSKIPQKERYEFLVLAVALAETKGFVTEQGIASYILALWYLGIDFEEKSAELESLLKGPYPEVRKVHAMNKWVEAVIGNPDDIPAADLAIKSSLKLTEPWGHSKEIPSDSF